MIVSIFSDASYDHKLRVGGWGAWARSDRGMESGGGAFAVSPSNPEEAEGYALVNALHFAFRSGIAMPGDRIVAGVDNEGVLQLVRGERPASHDWQRLVLRHLERFADEARVRFDFRHVKAHAPRRGGRNFVNNVCDRLAKQGLKDARERHAASPGMHAP